MPSEQSSSVKAIVYQAPYRPKVDRPSIILYGSILASNPWQDTLAASLSDLPIAILNPLRPDWDSSWVEDISFPKFKEQVEWEMDHGQVADVIVYNFVPGTLTPIVLLELGMHAATGKAVICCPEGYYKRGNVQMVSLRYGIPLFGTLDEVEMEVRRRMKEKLLNEDK
ncbi:hypothetical protein P154DRAFT_523497 [Amniculicola lignicola CBS 123094]|uniref:Nucleoside 2-deoxyribosyltransferase n=1 Tax=Amniculicola lignicola CBS 123094 TaxID=1392246 RepID=A0A6A5WDV2_9PLEO|nr:hypothetical protein P154DRAFT_523497 [Amniculicola lignicola CBS 123094]